MAKKKSQSYGDLLTLKGLKAVKEIKSAAKEVKKRGVGKSIGGAVRHAKRLLRRKKSEPKSKAGRPSIYATTRTQAIERAVGDVSRTKQYRRMKGRKK